MNLSLSLSLSLSLPPNLTGAIVGLDQSSYEVGESDGSLPVCVILYDGVLAEDVEVSVSSRRGGTGGMANWQIVMHFSSSACSL